MRRRGQIRIIEAILAVFMAVALILMVMGFTRPLRSQYIRETSDLRRLAYNVLSTMSQANTFEMTLADRIWAIYDSGGRWKPSDMRLRDLELFFAMSMPPGLLYRIEVYLLDVSGQNVASEFLGYAQNYDADSVQLSEAEPIIYTYTMTGSKSVSYIDDFSYDGLPGFISPIVNGDSNTRVIIDTSSPASRPPGLRTQVDALGTSHGVAAATFNVVATLGLVPAAGFTFAVKGGYTLGSGDLRNNVAYVSVGVDTNWDGVVDIEYIFYRYDTVGGSGRIVSVFVSSGTSVCSVSSDGSCSPASPAYRVFNLGAMSPGSNHVWSGVISLTPGRVVAVALVVVDASGNVSGDSDDFWVNWDDLQLSWSYESIRGTVLRVHLTIGFSG